MKVSLAVYNSIFKGNHNGIAYSSLRNYTVYNSIFKGNHNDKQYMLEHYGLFIIVILNVITTM